MNRLLQFFEYEHLPPALQNVSKEFHSTAHWMDENVPDGPEKTAGLRKLLEGKDCAVRAAFSKPAGETKRPATS